MLVCPHNGGIDDQVFEIRIFAQLCEKPLADAFFPSPETTKSVQRIAQSPLNETARAVGRCGKWRRGYQAPDLPSDQLASLPQRKGGRSACTQSVAPATTEQSSIGCSLITPHVYVTVFSSEKIDANEDAAIILDDV